MDIAIQIWNALWDFQIYIAVIIVLAIWIVVRGADLFSWIRRKLRRASGKDLPPAPPTT